MAFCAFTTQGRGVGQRVFAKIFVKVMAVDLRNCCSKDDLPTAAP